MYSSDESFKSRYKLQFQTNSSKRRKLARALVCLQVRCAHATESCFPCFHRHLILCGAGSGVQYWPATRYPGMAEMSALQDYYIHYFREFRCQDCGSDVAYASRPRSVAERYILPVFRFKMVRCADCFRRFARPASLPAREREDPKKAPHSQTPLPPVTGTRVA